MNRPRLLAIGALLATLVFAGCNTDLAVYVRDAQTHQPVSGVAVSVIAGTHNPLDWYRHRVVQVTDQSGRATFVGLANQDNAGVAINSAETTTSIPPKAKHQRWSAMYPVPAPYEVAVHTKGEER